MICEISAIFKVISDILNCEILFSFFLILVKDLSSLHNKHLNRPSMDDNMKEEHTIDVTTQEITQVCHFVYCFFYCKEKWKLQNTGNMESK